MQRLVLAFTLLTIGGSRTVWSGATLPMDLGPFGVPGCALNVSPDLLLPLVNTGGSARFSFHIPNTTSLVGVRVLMQGIVNDPRANAMGLVTSPGAMIQVGVR